MTETLVRNAGLPELAGILRSQRARKIDIVRSANLLRMEEGVLQVAGGEPQLDADGVTETSGRYLPTQIFDEGLADKLRIPLPFLRRLRTERVALYDAVVNGLLSGTLPRTEEDPYERYMGERDQRAFLLRCFRADDSDTGVARAFLSDSFRVIDNFDVLVAAIAGVTEAGVTAQVVSCDLSERRMVVRVKAPDLTVLAPLLLRGYRSPFNGKSGEELPVVFAGFEIANSEVGAGAFTITPRLIFEVCNNGAKITKDAMREVHLGGKLEEGVIRYSETTQIKAIELVTAKAKDAVTTFLDIEYMEKVLTEMTQQADTPVEPTTVIATVAKKFTFSDKVADGILDHFIRGGQTTAGGVMQAITSYAQTVDDADLAYNLENVAVEAMATAAGK